MGAAAAGSRVKTIDRFRAFAPCFLRNANSILNILSLEIVSSE